MTISSPSDSWTRGSLVDSIFNNLSECESNNSGETQNKYVAQIIDKLKYLRLKLPDVCFEIDKNDLKPETTKQIKIYTRDYETPDKRYGRLDGVITQVIARIAKKARPMILSDSDNKDIGLETSLNEIEDLVTFKWNLINDDELNITNTTVRKPIQVTTSKNGKSEEDNPLEQQNAISNILTSIKERYAEIFIDQLNRFYVTVRINDHTECIPLESSRFKNLVRKEYFDREKNILSEEKLDGIIKLVESELMFKDDNIKKIELNLRVSKTKDDDIIYYDLTNQKWEIIKITSKGWDIIKDNKIPIFKRYENNCGPQVYPSKEYDKGIFDKFIKLFNLKSKNDVMLLSVYIVSLFIPEIQKSILVISGDGGGAKTTTFEMIKKIVDPGIVDTFSFPKQINDIIQTLDHHYVNFFDNVSFISEEVSDLLCRSVTGSGNNKRALYQTDTDFIYKFKRCIEVK